MRNYKFVLNVAIGTNNVISFEVIFSQVDHVGELTETAPLFFDRLRLSFSIIRTFLAFDVQVSATVELTYCVNSLVMHFCFHCKLG